MGIFKKYKLGLDRTADFRSAWENPKAYPSPAHVPAFSSGAVKEIEFEVQPVSLGAALAQGAHFIRLIDNHRSGPAAVEEFMDDYFSGRMKFESGNPFNGLYSSDMMANLSESIVNHARPAVMREILDSFEG